MTIQPSMNPKTIEQWQSYLEGRYHALFDRSAVELVKSASERPMNFQAGEHMATDQLIEPLTATNAPLFGIGLRGRLIVGGTVHTGEPWHEQVCERDLQNGYASQHGFIPFSFDVDVCLSTAGELTETTGQFRSVNVWHIAFALVRLNPPAFSHSIRTSGKPLGEVIALLRSNTKRLEPGMYRVLQWRAIGEDHEATSAIYRLANEDRRTLFDILNRLEIKPSYAVTRALECAIAQVTQVVNIVGYAEAGVEHVLAGLLATGLEDDGMEHAEVSLPLKMVTALDFTEGKMPGLWNQLRSGATRDNPERGWRFSDALTSVLTEAIKLKDQCTPDDTWLAARHLLAAILARTSTDAMLSEQLESAGLDLRKIAVAFRDHLKSYQTADNPSAWRSLLYAFPGMLAEVPVIVAGTRFTPRREAPEDELCLNIDAYAAAIAETFRAANDEDDFVFALYGPWGRGKSTLIERVANILDRDTTGYKPIFFSAWKYPSRPEVWVHLYEKIAAAAGGGGLLQKMRIAFRVGILKSGWWPILTGLGLLALSRLPVLHYVQWLFDGIGIVGLIVLSTFLLRATTLGKFLAQRYFSIPSHVDKLGLQAVIGEDLRNLVLVWTGEADAAGTTNADAKPKAAEERNAAAINFRCCCHGWWMAIASIGMIWTASALLCWRLASDNSQPNTAALHFTVGVIIALAIGAAVMARQLCKTPQTCRKLFLIVDDLDRCEPQQMISVIESLRLFLDEDSISKRLQVAMLLDRNILYQALIRRGKRCASLEAKASPDKFCREQEEKFFVASIHLSKLDSSEVRDIVKNVIGKEYRHQLQEELRELNPIIHKILPENDETHADNTKKPSAESNVDSMAYLSEADKVRYEQALTRRMEVEQELEEVSVKQHRSASRALTIVSESDTSFETEERKLMRETLGQVDATELTPRSVRSFVLRYQLARLLLQHLNEGFNATELIRVLAAKLYPNSSIQTPDVSPAVRLAVHAVTGHD